MIPWVEVFGIGPLSLRLPSVLLGAASILLLYRLALREVGTVSALLAAALLALHGHHIFWSQIARMYAPATFLCLLSSLLLWRGMEDGRARFRIAYAFTAAASLWTHIYCWDVLAAQMVWSTARSIGERRRPIALPAQIAAIVASIPILGMMVYLYRGNEFHEPMVEFFEFGYLFWSRATSGSSTVEPPIPHALLLVLGVVSLALGFAARPSPVIATASSPEVGVPRSQRHWMLALGAVVSALLIGATFRGFRPGSERFVISMAIAIVPFIVAWSSGPVIRWLERFANRDSVVCELAARVRRMSPVIVAVGAPLAMITGAVARNFIGRGMLMMVPALLLVIVAGLAPRGRFRWFSLPAAGVLIGLHALSIPYSFEIGHGLRDYRAMAAAIEKRIAPTDLIFIVDDYGDQPLFYHMPKRLAQFVPSNYAGATKANPKARVWLVLWEGAEPQAEWREAVAGYHPGEPATVQDSRALLLVP
jgi:uncharacterized membrane protein